MLQPSSNGAPADEQRADLNAGVLNRSSCGSEFHALGCNILNLFFGWNLIYEFVAISHRNRDLLPPYDAICIAAYFNSVQPS